MEPRNRVHHLRAIGNKCAAAAHHVASLFALPGMEKKTKTLMDSISKVDGKEGTFSSLKSSLSSEELRVYPFFKMQAYHFGFHFRCMHSQTFFAFQLHYIHADLQHTKSHFFEYSSPSKSEVYLSLGSFASGA